MTRPTHITQQNGSSRSVLVDTVRPFPDQIRFALGRMNGSSFWAWSLWRAPEGANLLESLPFSDEYMQAAGSAEAMTVEVRLTDADGVERQYVVGKSAGDFSGAPSEPISWDDGRYSTTVFPAEVFTADEAAEVFSAYFLTDRVPAQYHLRELDMG